MKKWLETHTPGINAVVVVAALVAALHFAPAAPDIRHAGLPFLETPVSAQFGNSANVVLKNPYRVTVGGSAVQLTASGNVRGFVLKAICPGQTIYIGIDNTVTTSTGYPMADGETLTLEVRNANQVFAIASAASQSVAILPFERY